MTRSFYSALALCVFATFIQTARSGPACSKQYQNKAECMQFCRSRWGFNMKDLTVDQTGGGLFLGVDPWGVVIAQSGLSLDEWILAACTGQKPSTAPKKPKSSAVSSSTALSSSSSSSSNSSSVAPSSSSSSNPSSSPAPSFTPKKAVKVESQPPPPQTSPPPPPPPPPSPTKEDPKPSPPPPPSPTPTQGNDQGGNTGGAAGGGGGGGETGDDQQAWLDLHNSLRAKHGAGALSWSNEAAAKAQQWANNCQFKHSGGSLGPFGENLAAGTGDSYNVQAAFKSWADEEKDFNPGSPNPSHYTQVVWKGSTQVGCAVQLCDGIFPGSFGKSKYYVCEYSPQGNVLGQFGSNVQ